MRTVLFLFSACATFTLYCTILLPPALVSGIPAVSRPVNDDSLEDDIALCVVACARCHDTLGTVFDHIKCTRHCVRLKGVPLPDCHSVKTVRQFLRREFLEQYL